MDNDVIVPGADHASLPKNFEHGDTEERLYQWWEERGCFVPDPNAVGEPFCIAMPPPNVTGALHMGHAMFVTLQDVMARVARMRGRPTLWLPGSDHAGIATQLVVERALEADGLTREGIGREAFEKRTWEWKENAAGAGQIRRLGASCDWSRERFTLDDGLSDAVLESFIKLHDDGLIYKGTYMVNWAPKLQTAVSDLEVEYADEPGTLYYFRYPVAPLEDEDETELFLEVATSRPETILGDTAVAVNPTDERFQALIGRECVVPFTDPPRRVPIIGDEYVDVEFGTGALKVTPGHDPNDYEIGQRVGLETINIMNKDGTMNGVCGEAYESLDRFECRRETVAGHGDERFGDQDGAVSDARASIAAGRRDHRASRIRAVVLQDGHHGGAGTRGVRVRRARHRPAAVREDLPRLAHGHPRLVHLAAALVGTQDPGVLRARERRGVECGALGNREGIVPALRRRARRSGEASVRARG